MAEKKEKIVDPKRKPLTKCVACGTISPINEDLCPNCAGTDFIPVDQTGKKVIEGKTVESIKAEDTKKKADDKVKQDAEDAKKKADAVENEEKANKKTEKPENKKEEEKENKKDNNKK